MACKAKLTLLLLSCFAGDLASKDKEVNLLLTFDTNLHSQQLRKKRLRSFCGKIANSTKLPPTQLEASQVLSSIMVNNKLHFLYCKTPATGVEGWEQLLEMLEEKGVTLQMPIPEHQEFEHRKTLSEYNLTSMEAMLKSYTKVIFIREPFQRLISAYKRGLADGRTFKEFIQYIVHRGIRNASPEWQPLVSLCQPCLVQYDYIIMFGSQGRELHYLMLRAGLPATPWLPEFMAAKAQWSDSWQEEQLYSELCAQKEQLCHFFQLDLAAFDFTTSSHWDSTCLSGSK
ncbi:hypothetical protein lerEdw1_018842 [Lerista edwardsae]|nr:hypothetical protein lerEdw1_018842 [Lerista edwardsae]